MVDPPFLAGGGRSGKMNSKYTSYKTIEDMLESYSKMVTEVARIMPKGGVFVFKCQDILNGRTQTFTHCEVYEMALREGLYARDLLLLLSKNRLKPHNMRQQDHVRKAHSYYWVFEKCGKNNKRVTEERS